MRQEIRTAGIQLTVAIPAPNSHAVPRFMYRYTELQNYWMVIHGSLVRVSDVFERMFETRIIIVSDGMPESTATRGQERRFDFRNEMRTFFDWIPCFFALIFNGILDMAISKANEISNSNYATRRKELLSLVKQLRSIGYLISFQCRSPCD